MLVRPERQLFCQKLILHKDSSEQSWHRFSGHNLRPQEQAFYRHSSLYIRHRPRYGLWKTRTHSARYIPKSQLHYFPPQQ